MTTFGERLNALLKDFDRDYIVEKTGISQSQLYRLKSGNQDTSRENIAKLAEATNASAEWLVTGLGPMYRDRTIPQLAIQSKDAHDFSENYSLIPLYNVSAAAGHGAVVEHEEVVDSLAFKREWISHTLDATPADLYLINVQGESMTPTLHPGDVILVDRRNGENITTDGIYVIRMGDSLLVKRIQRLPGQKLRISSDNPAYQPYELKLDEAANDELAIIGRVVWSGRRM